jgi:hypothetical protein
VVIYDEAHNRRWLVMIRHAYEHGALRWDP